MQSSQEKTYHTVRIAEFQQMSFEKVAIETKKVGEKMKKNVKEKTEKKEQEETVLGKKMETLKELKELGENGGV